MSKVYEYHQEMEEIFADADYQDWLCQQQELSEQDLENMAQEHSPEAKAERFAKIMLEE